LEIIAGLGALNLDLIFEVDDLKSIVTGRVRLEPGKEVFGPEEDFQSLLDRLYRVGNLKSKSGGGSAANTVVALARMGFPAAFIGKVGDDPEGDFLLDHLRPVQTDRIRKGGRSGTCLVVLDRHQDRAIFVRANAANDMLTIEEIDLDQLDSIAWFHLTSFVGEPPFEAQKVLLRHLRPSTRVSMDPGEIYAKKGLERLRPLLQRCYILFLTENEIRLLTGEAAATGARVLLETGPSVIVCKKGSLGSHVFAGERNFEVPGEKVEVTDNTGAGDVYNAGFLSGLLLGRALEESARFATKIAARSVTGYGREKYPTREDLEAFFGPQA